MDALKVQIFKDTPGIVDVLIMKKLIPVDRMKLTAETCEICLGVLKKCTRRKCLLRFREIQFKNNASMIAARHTMVRINITN